MSQKQNIDQLLKEVDALVQKGKPASASELLTDIYLLAKNQGSVDDQVRALLMSSTIQNEMEEDHLEKDIERLQKFYSDEKDPIVKALLSNALGHKYQRYLDVNFYKINQRTQLDSASEVELNTMTVSDLLELANKYVLESLSSKEQLQKFEITGVEDLLITGDYIYYTKEEDLYLILSMEAIRFFQNTRQYVTQPAYQFELIDKELFANTDKFVAFDFESQDEKSQKLKVVQLFQGLLEEYSEEDDLRIRIELERLQYVYNYSNVAQKEEKYFEALSTQFEEYRNNKPYDFVTLAKINHRFKNLPFRQDNPWSEEQKSHLLEVKKMLLEIEKSELKMIKEAALGIQATIDNKHIAFWMDKTLLRNQEQLMAIQYRNVDELWCFAYRINPENYQEFTSALHEKSFNKLAAYKVEKTWKFDAIGSADQLPHILEGVVPALESGNYVMVVADNEKIAKSKSMSFSSFNVSNLAYHFTSNDGVHDMLVVHRMTGKPMADVKVELYVDEYDYDTRKQKVRKLQGYTSNEEGRVVFEKDFDRKNRSFTFRLNKGDDYLYDFQNRSYLSMPSRRSKRATTALYTDRSIYRPGQKVFFKGITYINDEYYIPQKSDTEVLNLIVRDANHQEFKRIALNVDEYGSFSGEFSLPKNSLKGNFSLQIDGQGGRKNIKVEEYKRPAFFIEFLPSAKELKLNDQVEYTFKASSYSGASINDARYKYRVYRQRYNPWKDYFYFRSGPWQQSPRVLIEQGVGKTDVKGESIIRFTDLIRDSVNVNDYNYFIEVDVTDITGETRSASKNFLLSKEAFQFNVSHETTGSTEDSVKINVELKNFEGRAIEKNATISLYKVSPKKSFVQEKKWPFAEFHTLDKEEYETKFPYELFSESDHPYEQGTSELFKSYEKINGKNLINLATIEPGIYAIKLFVEGQETKHISYLHVVGDSIFGLAGHEVFGGSDSYKPGQQVTQKFVGIPQDLSIHYRVFRKGRQNHQAWVSNNEKVDIEISQADYGNLLVKSFYVFNNRLYETSNIIQVPWQHKELEVEYLSFRDMIVPGAQETFTVRVKGDGPAPYQMTIGMYDASLDAITPNTVSLPSYPTFSHVNARSIHDFGTVRSSYIWWEYGYYHPSHFSYFTFLNISNPFYPQVSIRGSRSESTEYYIDGVRTKRSKSMAPAPAAAGMSMADSAEATSMDSNAGFENANVASDQDEAAGKENESIEKNDFPLRENLSETVFFYADMLTDNKGELSYDFTMNEALTEWKLVTLTQSKDLSFGISEKMVKTQKDLMIIPNMPRFLRQGDEVVFSAKVTNLSDTALEGIASIQIFNALTDEEITSQLIVEELDITFDVKESESGSVSWKLHVPNDFLHPLKIKVLAKSGDHTDGEQNMLPVLTNRKLIKASKAFMVKSNESKKVTFEHFRDHFEDEGLISQHFQTEFTTNPVWFAIKAMPYLQRPTRENAMSLSNHLYGNLLSGSIVAKYPKISEIFEFWNQDPEGLKSELQKNQDLKYALLEQTPWVRQALSEEDQRNDIALLFDLNFMANQQKTVLQELKKLQLPNGGFSWMPNGRDNPYVSLYVTEQLAKLKFLGLLEDPQAIQMMNRALKYCEERINEQYHLIEKRSKKKDRHLNNSVIKWAYVQSLLGEDQLSKNSTIHDFWQKQLKDYWVDENPSSQAMIGLYFEESGDEELALMIKTSLLERVIQNDELGAYWKVNNSAGWNDRPIQSQALMIEFFENYPANKELVDEMKMWLLTRKQTTHWESSVATASAIHALLLNSKDWIEGGKQPTIMVGNSPLQIGRQEAGTGYFEKQYDVSELNKDFATIKVENKNDFIIWGASYWQYWQDLDRIELLDENPFNIKKEVYLIKRTDQEDVLTPIVDDVSLQQGDKLKVRIELRTDRDLDFVHMQDMRASGLEPMQQISQNKHQDGLRYYQSTADLFTDFFFQSIRRGTYVFEYELIVTHQGTFSNGVTTAQCLYAPEFNSHSNGITLNFDPAM